MDFQQHHISVSKYILIVIVFIFSTNSANAQSKGRDYLSYIGVQTYYHNYEEPGVMEESGPFVGISLNIAIERGYYYGIEGLLSFGQVDYTSEKSGSMDGVNDFCFEVRGIMGKFNFKRGFTRVMPYTGLAYRYLSDDSSYMYTDTGYIGYLRVANYLYAPFGIRLSTELGKKWSIQAEAEYDLFIYGRQYSYMGYISGSDDIENSQYSGYGCRFSVGLINRTEKNIYDFKIFLRYWDIDDSEVTTDSYGERWIEPFNNTTEIGINASVLF